MEAKNNNQEILLESGTNELEIVEFTVGNNKFGINVMKVREIINPMEITKIPQSHPNVEGIIELRGEVLPVVDVALALGFPPSDDPGNDKYIVAEYNKYKIVFHVHSVTQIHRVSWEQVEKPNTIYQGLVTQITGVIKLEEAMILLLDFEKILVDINPEAGIDNRDLKQLGERSHKDKRILLAEDSPLLRKLILETLEQSGYSDVECFENGLEAWEYLSGIAEKEDVTERVQLVITDIEMPQMDGHHLTRKIKEDSRLANLPVVIFSSIITDDLHHKGQMVGASAQVSKPEIVKLVQYIDELSL